MSHSTGYSITFDEFVQLLTYPPYRKSIAPMIETWFDGKLIIEADGPVLKTSTGEIISLAELHETIQVDQKMQYDLYQAAMTLWR